MEWGKVALGRVDLHYQKSCLYLSRESEPHMVTFVGN
jgi:hypothetical protein